MSASDSHRAEVRAKVLNILAQWRAHNVKDADTALYDELALDDIMVLLDSERKRWVGEVKNSLPPEHEYTNVPDDRLNPQEDGEVLGWNNYRDAALDAVSKVLDEL